MCKSNILTVFAVAIQLGFASPVYAQDDSSVGIQTTDGRQLHLEIEPMTRYYQRHYYHSSQVHRTTHTITVPAGSGGNNGNGGSCSAETDQYCFSISQTPWNGQYDPIVYTQCLHDHGC